MFEFERSSIESSIQSFCAQNAIPYLPLRWAPIPFSGEWGLAVSFFQIASAEIKAGASSGKPVPQRAAELAELALKSIPLPGVFSRSEALKGYLNFYFSTPKYAAQVVNSVLSEGARFGAGDHKGERVMVEYAQPNTHHSFHIGHARNTILGESVARIESFAGYQTLRASYPGDIGLGVITVVWAYDRFYKGKEPEGIHERGQWLARIYTEATAMLEPRDNETDEQRALREGYEEERRDYYRRWDAGDEEIRDIWQKTREWSLEELRDILGMFGAEIDVWFFESEVDEPSKRIVEELIERDIATDERPTGGAVIVKIDEKLGLNKEKYRTNVILRSDGTTLYLTKDLALAKVKFEKYHIDRSVYVVDVRQSLHLQQTFAILKLMGFVQSEKCHHLAYGYVSLPEGAMSARKGRVVLFKEVYDEARLRVLNVIAEKNPSMPDEERQDVATKIGMGALCYSMLSVDNNKDIIFDINEALSFDGRTGPYIQNAYVRANSILKKSRSAGREDPTEAEYNYPLTSHEVTLLEQITRFPELVQQAAIEYRPMVIAMYAYDLADTFHSFYHAVPVLQAEDADVICARLRLVMAAKQTIANALTLLGITAPEVM